MNTFGEHFTFTSFGESHGRAIGGVLDGVPAGVRIDLDLIRQQLDRRAGRRVAPSLEAKGDRAPQNATSIFGDPAEARGEEHPKTPQAFSGTPLRREAKGERLEAGISPRALREADEVEWLSGVMDGVTLGTPIAFIIRNQDARPEDYEWLKHTYRIGHADHTYQAKYGIRDHRGGGRSSARETASRVVAGTIAQQLLQEKNIHIHAKLVQVGEEKNPDNFDTYIASIQHDGDSIGGIVQCTITGLPIGIGEPIFDKLQAHLAFAMMSINACKGFDYGSGFEGINKTGSEMYLTGDQTLISGGIAGGISDGTPIVFRCVFKPTASNKKTFERAYPHPLPKGKGVKQGRHDACVAVRAVPVVEAMAAMVIADWHDF